MHKKYFDFYRKKNFNIFAISIVLSAICGVRALGLGKDYHAYVLMFEWARVTSYFDLMTFQHFDYIFGFFLLLIANVLPLSNELWFVFFAFVGLLPKIYFIGRASPYFFVGVVGYMAMFFVLHDYTQIRAALGLGFFMLGVLYHFEKKSFVKAFSLYVIAMSCHWSLSVLIVFAIVFSQGLPLFIFVSVIALFGQEFIGLASLFFERVNYYNANAASYERPNFFSSLKIFQYATLVLFFVLRNKIRERGWVFVDFSGWFLFSGLCMFFGFSHNPVLAHRFSELFIVFTPILVSGIFLLLPSRFGTAYLLIFFGVGLWSSYKALA